MWLLKKYLLKDFMKEREREIERPHHLSTSHFQAPLTRALLCLLPLPPLPFSSFLENSHSAFRAR